MTVRVSRTLGRLVCFTPFWCAVFGPCMARAQTASPQPYRDPYTSGPTRPLDGSPRTNYSSPASNAPLAPAIWNGLYLGAQLGYRWSNTSIDGLGTPPAKTAGPQFGALIGTNYQSGPLVVGFESDLMLGSASASTSAGSASFTTQDNWTSTVRARAGFAYGQALFYGTGGLAIAGQSLTATAGSASSQLSQVRAGSVFGAGFEYKFAPQVSARIEALHFNYKEQTLPWSAGTPSVKQDSTAIRGGLTFHFN